MWYLCLLRPLLHKAAFYNTVELKASILVYG